MNLTNRNGKNRVVIWITFLGRRLRAWEGRSLSRRGERGFRELSWSWHVSAKRGVSVEHRRVILMLHAMHPMVSNSINLWESSEWKSFKINWVSGRVKLFWTKMVLAMTHGPLQEVRVSAHCLLIKSCTWSKWLGLVIADLGPNPKLSPSYKPIEINPNSSLWDGMLFFVFVSEI